MTRHPTTYRASASLYAATAVAVVTAAALLWLRQSNQLASTGLAIYDLESQRQELLEERSMWLAMYAHATDPATLARRAQAMGFGPIEDPEFLAVHLPPSESVALASARDDSTLALMAIAPRPVAAGHGPLARWIASLRGPDIALADAPGTALPDGLRP